VDFLVQARRDADLRRVLREAHLVLCDGMPLVLASRLLGNRLPERVTGADLVPRLLGHASEKGQRVFFLGGTPEVNELAVARLRERFPKLNIAGHYAPPICALEEMDQDEIARRITAARPDLLFVAFGCPKAEKWMARHHQSLGVPVMMGVGGTIDMLAGRVRRAPRWMQQASLEWFYRLVQEPRRLFRRYATDFGFFFPAVLAQWAHLRLGLRGRPSPPLAHEIVSPEWHCAAVRGRLDAAALRRDSARWHLLTGTHRHCLIDLTEASSLDSTAMGLLLRLHHRLAVAGRQLVLLAPPPAVRSALRALRLDDFFIITSDTPGARHLLQRAARIHLLRAWRSRLHWPVASVTSRTVLAGTVPA
jgi:exopolysaccharide biosynthesis WecB/TagA/CpsF family protein